MDYLQRLYSDSDDPIRSGDMRSWFFFYKWQVEGEIHFDITQEDKSKFFNEIGPGDRLWFTMDESLVGYVNVLRVEEDPTRDLWEIWYDGSLCHKYTQHKDDPSSTSIGVLYAPHVGSIVPSLVAAKWLEHCSVEDDEA